MAEKEKALKSLWILRNLLTDDVDLKLPIHDEKFLIRFVRGEKYDAEAAHETVRKYYTLRRKNPKIFRIAYPSYEPVKEILENNAVVKLKCNDPEGRAIVVWNYPKWDPEKYSLDHMIAALVLVLEELLFSSVEVQTNGVIIVGNNDSLSLAQIKQFSPARIKSILEVLEGSFPLRLHKFLVVNEPSLIETIMSLASPFMTTKFKERMVFHGKDFEKFHKSVPADKLPKDFGGTLTDEEAYDQTFKENLFKRDSYYKELLDYGYGEWDIDGEDTCMWKQSSYL